MEALTTTLTATDAWGREHSACIAWKPATVTISEDMGGSLVLWADESEPPACWAEDPAFRHLELQTVPPIALSGSWREVVRPVRVEDDVDPDLLEPGQWTRLTEDD